MLGGCGHYLKLVYCCHLVVVPLPVSCSCGGPWKCLGYRVLVGVAGPWSSSKAGLLVSPDGGATTCVA